MNPIIREDDILEFETFGEDNGFMSIAAECSWRGFAVELQELHYLKGARFINQLKLIAYYGEFHSVEPNIFSAISEENADYNNLINAAHKAVEHGYRVYILPNPKGVRTADFIFERKGVYKLFDLKSIIGKASVCNRLMESIGQTNHVILNMLIDYEPRMLAKDVKTYFEVNRDAKEVLIMKGREFLSVSRRFVEGNYYFKMFLKRYLR